MLDRLRIGTKIGTGFALGLAFFAAIAVVSYRGINQLVDSARRETHTYQVLGKLEELNSQIKDIQIEQRNYLLTGETQYLQPFNTNVEELDRQIQELRNLTADNLEQQSRIDDLEPLIAARVEYLQELIDIRQRQGIEAAQRSLLTNSNRQNIINETNRLLEEIEAEERKLLVQRSNASQRAAQRTLESISYGVPIYSVLLILIGFVLTRHISRPLRQVSAVAEKLGAGDLSVRVPTSDRTDEIGVLATTFNQMIDSLRETTRKNDEQSWLQSNLAEFSRILQGRRNQEAVARLILSNLAPLVGAQQGVFYLMDADHEPPILRLLSSYAYQERKRVGNQFRLGEGLVGQCALEKQRILLTDVPSDYTHISSGLGEAPPLNVVVLPVLFENEVNAVIELASFQRFSEIHLTFLEHVCEGIGVVMSTIAADIRTNQLLQTTQALAEELQHQQEELQESNQRLEKQTEELRASETLLREQQEELQQTNEELQQLNEELEEKAELLSAQKQEVEYKNQEIERARRSLEEKAEQLALSSKYKSEFLANMSHELRTPLNSLLILARLLAENGEGNLTEKQVEYSNTIYSAGADLLLLINEILDLAKIESGMMSVDSEPVLFSELQISLERIFRQIARNKGLSFDIEVNGGLPQTLSTDPKRLQQILKNLLSNAFKFTEHGGVTLRIFPAQPQAALDQQGDRSTPVVAFAVNDTGIGIPADKQAVIFEAFQQADGTTSRKYGGTGLGLSISRELAKLLGGWIELTSRPGQGSTFTLYLPLDAASKNSEETALKTTEFRLSNSTFDMQQPATTVRQSTLEPQPLIPNLQTPLPIADDRNTLQPSDRVLLIIEDDINFVQILLEMGRKQGFKVLVALNSNTGLALARQFKPHAIMLDLRLPGMDGWAVLDRLKHDPETRHIPVHILSIDEAQQRGLQLGAIAYLQKPVSPEDLTQAFTNINKFIDRQVKNLLVIEDDRIQAQSIRDLIGNGDVQTTIVNTGSSALTTLRSNRFDCVVLDLGLPDMSGFELIEQIKQEPGLATLPIIVYTGKELSRQEETQLKRLAETIIIKDVRSPERLFDETALFLHRVQAELPQAKRQLLEKLHQSDPVLANKKVLIVDDDVRNIFALTSLLEQYEMEILYAENGRDAIAVLQNNPDINIILMDVMMPAMDGYETTRAIRQQDRFRTLPIVALTAKAMQGDREKCLEAGASDYITKPVDTEQLVSLLRVWLYP